MKKEIARREIDSLDYYLQNHTDDYSEESHPAMMMAISALSENTGEWIEDEDIDVSDDGRFAVKCSECGKHNGYSKTNFCPNCGADMRGKAE